MTKHIASVSFGKDSLAMLLRLIAENRPLDEVVFYDTGMEFQAIYRIRDKIKPLLHEKGIAFTELKPARPFTPAIDIFINPNIAIPSVDAIQTLIQESVGIMADMILDEIAAIGVRLSSVESSIADQFIGGVIAAPLSSLTGFLKCDGAAVSRTTYAKLFAKIGTVFGVGNGSSTFALPDYRGLFLRGLGGNAATNFTDTQGDAIRNIWGEFGQWKFQIHAGTIVSAGTGSGGKSNSSDGGADPWWRSRFSADQQVPTAAENRPVNKAVNWFIKY